MVTSIEGSGVLYGEIVVLLEPWVTMEERYLAKGTMQDKGNMGLWVCYP